jgi:serine/threonine-protein kinase
MNEEHTSRPAVPDPLAETQASDASGVSDIPHSHASADPRPAMPAPGDTQAGRENASRQIPGYQILEKLGAGAMAVVFKARQLSLDRTVAIKVLPKKLSADKAFVERFYAEGQAAAKLNHTNIVQAIDVGEAHGYHYFVMEYVEGHTVYDRLHDGEMYTEAEALNVCIQIARALEHAHSQGLIHRDVKPKNIMITRDGIAKLMDMGLARVADDAAAIEAEAGKLYGTPYYISPEQILGKEDVDFRCDIYSLGATLYHMVTGRVPFDGETSREVMVKHCKQTLVPPDRYNMDLSFGLVKLIQKMMSKRRMNRHKSTEALLEDLQSVDFLLEVENPQEGSGLAPDMGQHMEKVIAPEPDPDAAAKAGLAPTPKKPGPAPKRTATQPKGKKTAMLVALIVSVLLNVFLMVLLLAG